ncbi:MAG: hypothetical protein KF691_13790 [Phycisphaeraceae bacterium]|nr:hypothetical protein [Phycisphaeraceae bacterium]
MARQPSIPTPTPAVPVHFDYRGAAQAAKLSENELRTLVRIFEIDYPDDLMLRELHVLRACNAIVRGLTTIGQVLGSSGSQAA